MEKVFLILHEYREAEIELYRLRENERCLIKGSLVKKKVARRVRGTIYNYYYHYIEVSETCDGVRKKTFTYIPSEQIDGIMVEFEKRKVCIERIRWLAKKVKDLKPFIKKYIKSGLINFADLNEEIRLMIEFGYKTGSEKKEVINQCDGFKVITRNHEYVRSKAEAIIADCLYLNGLEYLYEREIEFKPKGNNNYTQKVKPDFTVIQGDNMIYVEFFGMMDNTIYNENSKRKILEYQINDIQMGNNLICFSCYDSQKFNCDRLDKIIKEVKTGIIPDKIIKLDMDIY